MSLFKQMVIMLTLFLGIILISVMVLNFKTATVFVQNQLYTDAKNTAHSLGLSLSKVADVKDISTMETMINAIFDSGYHERIVLTDIDGKVVYNRESDFIVSNVPQWFVGMVDIHSVGATSEIMVGWSRFGTLEVRGHTGNAYRQLYATLISLVETFLVLGAVVFGLLYLLLSLSLKSLERIRDQAKGIIENKFIFEDKIPFTTEFRSVTAAMNAMVGKVKDIFDRENETLRRYHELLYKDPETKLHNRRYLTAKLPDYLQSHSSLSSGVYVILSFDEIERLKRELGYYQDISLLKAVSDELVIQLGNFEQSLIVRLNESDFFVIIPESDIASVRDKIEDLMFYIRQKMETIDSITSYMILGCGIGTYTEHDTLKSLFSRADHAVVEAKLKGSFTIEVSSDSNETLVLGREEWRNELLLSLEESRIILASQSVMEYKENSLIPFHEEIFLRLLDKDGAIHNAGYFIPFATSLGLVDMLDRYMIKKVLSHMKEKHHTAGMAINISYDFVKKSSNLKWLDGQLKVFQRHTASNLCFEVTNAIANSAPEEVTALSDMVKTFGYCFGIDHFVFPESGADYLQIIRPDYVKSNAIYLKDILYDNDTNSARESFNNLAKSLGIEIIATNIEEADQVENLKKVGIKRFQGIFISPVVLLT